MKTLIFSLLCVSASAVAAPAIVLSKGTAPLVSIDDFAVRAPQEGAWHGKVSRQKVVYAKKLDGRDGAMLAIMEKVTMPASQLTDPALLDFVRARVAQRGGADPDRDAQLATTVSMDAQLPHCVRWEQSVHDVRENNGETQASMQMQSSGRFCMSEHNPASAVDVSYSVRRVAPDMPDGLAAEGEAFLASLQRKSP